MHGGETADCTLSGAFSNQPTAASLTIGCEKTNKHSQQFGTEVGSVAPTLTLSEDRSNSDAPAMAVTTNMNTPINCD